MTELRPTTAYNEERGWFVLLEFPTDMPRRVGITMTVARAMSEALLKAAEKVESESHG